MEINCNATGRHADDGAARLLFPRLKPFYAGAEPIAYLLLRFTFGATLLTHGWPKLVGGAHGGAHDAFALTVTLAGNYLRLPGPIFFAYVVTVIETLGAVFLALGFATRIVAPIIAVEMLLICGVFWPVWPAAEKGMEYAFFMGVLALFMSMRGGGRYSIDRLFGVEI